MTAQEQKEEKPITGSNVAPKGHGAGCACCMSPYMYEDDDE